MWNRLNYSSKSAMKVVLKVSLQSKCWNGLVVWENLSKAFGHQCSSMFLKSFFLIQLFSLLIMALHFQVERFYFHEFRLRFHKINHFSSYSLATIRFNQV